MASIEETAPARGGASRGPTLAQRAGAYVAVTKPRIIELLLVTTLPTMFLAAGGWPRLSTAVAVVVGGALAAAGANTLNSVYDRDIDAVMRRTAHRPMVSGVISPRAGIAWGVTLSVGSVIVLAVFTNLLAAALAIVAIVFYVFGYTMWLKRRTPQNIVWGGAAGCMPVLIAWAAVTGSLTWAPLVLFFIIFLWTPPHYWPLSLRYRDDYAQARVPMLPVVADQRVVARQIVVYSWLMVAASLALIPLAPMGWVYVGAAVVLGVIFLAEAYALRARVNRASDDLRPMRLFHWSITYLALLFLAVAVDPFIG
ncbi:MAG: heme o synthase [Actinomycetota bacterium]